MPEIIHGCVVKGSRIEVSPLNLVELCLPEKAVPNALHSCVHRVAIYHFDAQIRSLMHKWWRMAQ